MEYISKKISKNLKTASNQVWNKRLNDHMRLSWLLGRDWENPVEENQKSIPLSKPSLF